MSPLDGLPDRPFTWAEGHDVALALVENLRVTVALLYDDDGRVPAILLGGHTAFDALVFDLKDEDWKLLEEWSRDRDDRDIEPSRAGGLA